MWDSGKLLAYLGAICPLDGNRITVVDPQDKNTWVIPAAASATTAQKAALVTAIAALSTTGRKPRLLVDILSDFTALSAGQKANINTNFFLATRPLLWESDSGSNAAGIVAIVANAGSIAALTTTQKIGIAALYAQDVPGFFVQPSWDTTINIAGDQLG